MNTECSHFYVDEAGDLTLLGRRGRNLVGTEGVSNTFMVATACIANPAALKIELDSLRRNLLNDPYLAPIPSLSPVRKKTALCFHAKDDCPEVRMAVFKVLAKHDVRVIVAIRRKKVLAELAQKALGKGVRISADSIYDNMVTTLFKSLLHTSDENVIYFARRGKSSRQAALTHAITRSKHNFTRDTGIPTDVPTKVIPSVPSEEAGLQAIDYFLWAVQRLYERSEDRYFEFLRPRYRLIMDFDDKRYGKAYGRWYSDSDPLTKEKMLPSTG